MPSGHDPNGGELQPDRDLVDDGSRSVGFLDIPHVDADELIEAILHGFSRLDDDAVLTAYSTRVGVDAITALCEQHGVELVHSVPHASGTTFILKRSNGETATHGVAGGSRTCGR